jgi:hypothetical protein
MVSRSSFARFAAMNQVTLPPIMVRPMRFNGTINWAESTEVRVHRKRLGADSARPGPRIPCNWFKKSHCTAELGG